MRFARAWGVLGALLLLLAGSAAEAASFDCKKAATPTEKQICSDETLSRLDEQLDDAYTSALKRVASRPDLRAAQRTWLSTRRDVCKDVACLRAAYIARIDALLDEATANPTTATLELNASKAREPQATKGGTCGGFPRLDIGMAKGFCAGLVAGPTATNKARTIRMPRSLVQLDANTWLVSDLGGWVGAKGAVWRLRTQDGQSVEASPVFTGLTLPHALVKGADGFVYVGEMGRIARFDPKASVPRLEAVVSALPDNRLHDNRHPLSAFVFDRDGALLVNVGAPSDQCLGKDGKPVGAKCAESESGEQAASIRRYAPLGKGKWDPAYTVHAKGLRNSIALVRHDSGTILQGENSYDFESRLSPFEELNVIESGRHYGWPYCFDLRTPSPGWKDAAIADCANAHKYTPPSLLLPPHASPLGMLYYRGRMFPQLEGKLLVTFHGFRSVGGRIAAFDVDAKGVPLRHANAKFPVHGGASIPYGAKEAANAFILTPGWNKVVGVRPQGSPVGLAVAQDGAIWTTDDRAGLVIRIAADRP